MSVNHYLDGSLNPKNIIDVAAYNIRFNHEHPDYFHLEGLLIFSGSQGSGKTISAVQYIQKVMHDYPKAVLCTNTFIKTLPINCVYEIKTVTFQNIERTIIRYVSNVTGKRLRTVVMYTTSDGVSHCIVTDYEKNPGYTLPLVCEYDGLDCIKLLSNGEYGILYDIDEIHLEFNSLESKNIPIEVMIEVSQQRKQRKHIVGTTQVYGRMAKPLREQIRNVVLCQNYFRCIQINTLIDGDKSSEEDGKLVTESVKKFIWFHSPKLYDSYDTYAKMKRYSKEWKGRAIQ